MHIVGNAQITGDILLEEDGAGTELLTITAAALGAARTYTIPDAGGPANFIVSTSTPAQGDILYHNGTTWVSLVAGTSGYYLKTQGAAANPVWAAIPAGGISWNEIAIDTNASVNNGYIANHAVNMIVITLPATASVGDIIRVTGIGAGGWRIAQQAGTQVHFGLLSTTAGAGGKLESTENRDSVELVCVKDSGTYEWNIISSVGNIDVT